MSTKRTTQVVRFVLYLKYMNGLVSFFHGVGVAIGTAFIAVGAFFTGQPQSVSPSPMVATSTASVQTTVAPLNNSETPTTKGSGTGKKPAPLPAVQTAQTPVIQVPVNTTANLQTQPATEPTKGYYENGAYVYLTDAEHQALLQQLQSSVQSLKNQEQPYIDDLNKAESEIQNACASALTVSGFQQGNAAVAAQTQASICASTSQAYGSLIQIDRQAINYYEAKIQSLQSSYN